MAEKDAERRVRIYRSVSFKRLENWNAKAFGEEGGTQLAGKRDVTQPTCQKAHRSPARSLSLSRKVSKISAASTDQHIPCPSVRQLSQRFGSYQGAQSDEESLQCVDSTGDHMKGDCQKGSLENYSPDVPAHSCQLKQEPLLAVGCDNLALPGKVDMLAAAVPLRGARSSEETSLDEVTLDSYCSLLYQSDNREVIGVEGANWPSVTEMRKLFGERIRKPPTRAASLPDCEEPRHSGQPAVITEPQRHCPAESTFAKCFNHYAKDTAYRPKHLSLGTESTYCRALSDSNTTSDGIVCMDTKEQKLNTGPKPQPPPPPPRSCIPFGLKAHSLSSGLPKQEARRQSDSLHSLNSSGKPQAAPSNVRFKDSSSEEEMHSRGFQLPSTANKNGSKVRSQEMSSGSEEEEHLVTLRGSLRKRSIKKKKKDFLGCKNNEFGDGLGMIDSVREKKVDHDQSYSEMLPQKTDVGKTSTEHNSSLTSAVTLPTESKQNTSAGVPSNIHHEGHKPHFKGFSEGVAPSSTGQLAAASPIPIVSRVAKVNIPPFMPSPCGSRSSSRYSSTETLKEDDHFSSCYSGQSRSFQGGFNLYRSPSFGQSDNISRQPARPKPKVPPSIVKVKSERVHEGLYPCDLESENAKHKKSMSNPDIASETLTLLSFLKSDISELKIRNRGRGGSDQDTANCRHETPQDHAGHQHLQGKPTLQNPSRLQQGNRPTLKDLTATLRRTKSFTYSDKPGSRRVVGPGIMKQSSSELMLASTGDTDVLLPDRKADNDVGRKGENVSDIIQDQYIQEARQVFEKISQISSQNDYNFENENSEHLKCDLALAELQAEASFSLLDNRSEFIKSESEENMSCRKSLEELSGHESSMTDEGIVTEVETVPNTTLYRDLGQTLTVWKSAGIVQGENEQFCARNGEIPLLPPVNANLESTKSCDKIANKSTSQEPLDAPPTPGSIRRRRKFPSLGNNGTDSSNGSNGDSSSETYRSLSDPMPHRRYSITEDPKSFSVDSNLLGSLHLKSGIPESSAIGFSECTGSAASVLSFSSDGVKDYNTVIQNIVSQPGALDKVIDEKGNGKTIKKKSFSDPSRRGELSPTDLEDSSEPIKELEWAVPSSSSEPILSEQREELGDLEELADENGVEVNQNFSFDPKLAEVLSPRMIRRSFKKRTGRACSQESKKECGELMGQDTLGKPRPTTKHVRHTSEPATFIPITSPESKVSGHTGVQIKMPESAKLPIKPYPVLQGPSLEDDGKPYMATLNTGDSNVLGTVDIPRTAPSTPTTAEPKLLKAPKPQEEVHPGNRSKPYVLLTPDRDPDLAAFCLH
ncbi:hypothetical protein FKM82_009897 [Ascaphus truei]